MRAGSNKARKEASKRLGLKLYKDYRALVEASGNDEIQVAAIELGNTFNTNVEFIINVLKAYGGMDVKFEPLTNRIPKTPNVPANDEPTLPDVSMLTGQNVLAIPTACTCPPLEHGIIGRDRHMTSCPQFTA